MEVTKVWNKRLTTFFLILGISMVLVGAYLQVSPFMSKGSGEELTVNNNEQLEHQTIEKSPKIDQKYAEVSVSAQLEEVNVDVSGAVVKSGVYQLPTGARLTQALDAAGGLSKVADQSWVAKNLNLAVRLKDGDKIYIPQKGEIKTSTVFLQSQSLPITNPPSISPSQPSPAVAGVTTGEPGLLSTINSTSNPIITQSNSPDPNRKISVNTATAKELDTLPGVGEVTAKKIIDNRPYTKIEELKEKKAVNKSTFEKIKDKISI